MPNTHISRDCLLSSLPPPSQTAFPAVPRFREGRRKTFVGRGHGRGRGLPWPRPLPTPRLRDISRQASFERRKTKRRGQVWPRPRTKTVRTRQGSGRQSNSHLYIKNDEKEGQLSISISEPEMAADRAHPNSRGAPAPPRLVVHKLISKMVSRFGVTQPTRTKAQNGSFRTVHVLHELPGRSPQSGTGYSHGCAYEGGHRHETGW